MELGTKFRFIKTFFFMHSIAGAEDLLGYEFELTRKSPDFDYCTNTKGEMYLLNTDQFQTKIELI